MLNQFVVHYIRCNFVPMVAIASKVYGVSPMLLNWTMLIFPGSAVLLSFPSVKFIERFGVKRSIQVGALITVPATWMRFFVLKQTDNLYLAMSF